MGGGEGWPANLSIRRFPPQWASIIQNGIWPIIHGHFSHSPIFSKNDGLYPGYPLFAARPRPYCFRRRGGQGEDAGFVGNVGRLHGGHPIGVESNPEAGTDGKAGGGGQQQQDPMAGIKNLVDSIDPNQINQFLKNIASPDSLFDWIPAKFRGLLPEEWRAKMGEVLVSELDNLALVWEGVAKHKSGGDLWKALKSKTPTLAELLEEMWAAAVEKWAQFEGALAPEADGYVQNLKSTFGQWLSHQLLGFTGLSNEAKLNLRDAFEKAFPLLEPVVTKAVQSEGLGKWADGLGKKKEEEEEGKKVADEKKETKEKTEEMKEKEKEEEKDEL